MGVGGGARDCRLVQIVHPAKTVYILVIREEFATVLSTFQSYIRPDIQKPSFLSAGMTLICN